jgi:leucyl-tRNA synthetase
MELLNASARHEGRGPQDRALRQEALEAVVLMLSPIVPHACHASVGALGREGAVVDQPWPGRCRGPGADEVELVVQVQGKLRGRIRVARDAAEEEIRAAALPRRTSRASSATRPVRKLIVVPGRLVNIVV